MERKLIANHLVPDNEVWVSPQTWDSPFTKSMVAGVSTSTNTGMFQLLSDIDVHLTFGKSGSKSEKELINRITAKMAQLQHA